MNEGIESSPCPGVIMDRTVGAYSSLAMLAEIQMGVFTVLKEGPLAADVNCLNTGKGRAVSPALL
ncbi:MAG: hypothetical protein WA996_20710 [Candidatus Promineifilaceae bacterium]